jgi:hypothetical protein
VAGLAIVANTSINVLEEMPIDELLEYEKIIAELLKEKKK